MEVWCDRLEFLSEAQCQSLFSLRFILTPKIRETIVDATLKLINKSTSRRAKSWSKSKAKRQSQVTESERTFRHKSASRKAKSWSKSKERRKQARLLSR